MDQNGQLGALEKAVEGTLAEDDFEFDEDAGVLRVEGGLILSTGWTLSSAFAGIASLLTGAVLSFTGPDGWASFPLAAGVVLLALPALYVLALRFTPLPRLWPDLEVRFAEQEIAYRDERIPLSDVRAEHLVRKRGRFFDTLHLRHPQARKQLAGFFATEERAADEFQRLLWELLSKPDLNAVFTYGSDLTPVQRWIIGAAAPYGAINGFRVDRLGTAPAEDEAASDRRTAQDLLQEPWGAYDLDQLLAAVNWLVQDGHRADFGQDAALAARPEEEKAEYARLLREVDELIARDRMEPPFVERLIELVKVRYGVVGEEYARLVPGLLRDEPGADASEEGAELGQFLTQLFNDRDHATEELHRLDMLSDPALQANVGRFLIWDYARALMLYRWGHMVGWLTEEYCWDRMLPLAIDIQRRYSSWRDMATCYLQGRMLWSGGTEGQEEYEKLVTWLAEDPHSPWTLVPWNLELKRDWT
ncbi:DUF1266 domain-containing protein [Actinomadura barringtoniae]|uniref:DUF1266 domain-containing protein n=1 Tax=Actinomadura barringtoniae TaxID=1427535 RepID=A0A939PK03_9ACTN|nr:DUF1266 domain-containing protein [Actinomadura barringtoniae]MBO2454332.1 DUF1266 domain-containing protein [Actinomadura barringtoniae]